MSSSEPEGHIKTVEIPTPVQLVGVDESLRDSIKGPQQTSIAPTTTAEEQRVTAGQRGINKIWELTQSLIALVVTVGIVVICVLLVLSHDPTLIMLGVTVMSTSWTLIIAFYFQRTNHSRIGGVAPGQEGR